MAQEELPVQIASSSEAEAQNRIEVPVLIGDRYQVIEVIGQGGMGTVLKASHVNLSKTVAIKILNPGMLVDDIGKERFKIEATAGSKLSHPHLVAVFDYGFTKGGDPYLVMEYVEGESLDNMIVRLGKIDTKEFINTFTQVGKALHYIHSQNIIHRDLKPSNIMIQIIGDDHYAKLLDFGIAKVLSDSGYATQHLTTTGTVFGSPPYMSPEQCQGLKTDGRSDLYSLGCVMYECLTGRPPLTGENALQTIFKHVNERPEPIRSGNRVELQIGQLIMRCLEKDPALRFPSVNDMLAELNRIRVPEKGEIRLGGTNPIEQERDARPQVAGLSEHDRLLLKDLGNKFETKSQGQSQSQDNSRDTSALNDPAMTAFKDLQGSPAARRPDTGDFPKPAPREIERQPASRLRDDDDRPATQMLRGVHSPAFGWSLVVILVMGTAVVQFAFPHALDSIRNNISQMWSAGPMKEGETAMAAGAYKQAESKFQSALTFATTPEIQGKIQARLGRAQYMAGDTEEALKSFSTARHLLEPVMKHSDEARQAYLDAYLGQAQTLSKQNNYSAAERTFNKVRDFAEKWASKLVQADIALASAENARRDNLRQALRHYDDAINLYEASKEKEPVKFATTLITSAELRLQMGYRSLAVKQAQQAIDIARDQKVPAELKTDVSRRAETIVNSVNAGGHQSSAMPLPIYQAPTMPPPPPALSNYSQPAYPIAPPGVRERVNAWGQFTNQRYEEVTRQLDALRQAQQGR